MGPDFLGANLVVPLPDFLSEDASGTAFDLDALRLAFVQGKQRARGGMTVELVKGASQTAVLYVPGKEHLLAVGNDQVAIIERLVNAYHDGSLLVRTGALMEGTGSQSPSQAFPNWRSIVGVYIGSPKKGFWQLLV